MARRSISYRTQQYHRLIEEWTNFYKEPLYNLIAELYRQGWKQQDIARVIKTTPQNVSNQYPYSLKETYPAEKLVAKGGFGNHA